MTKDDIKILSIIAVDSFPMKVECKSCGEEHYDNSKIDFKVLRYELELKDGRKMQFTRSYEEPAGEFYDWICGVVLPDLQDIDDDIEERSTQEIDKEILSKPRLAISGALNVFADHSNIIEREDIVKCVKQERDLDGNVNEDITVGEEYRVIDIYKVNGQIAYYEILDDKKNNKIRIQCLASEVELLRKRVKPPPKKQIFSIIKKCTCGENNSLDLNGDRYQGKCTKCGCVMEVMKEVKV